MSFENDYTELLKIADILICKQRLHIEPSEMVSNAYLHFHDNNIPYSKQTFSKLLGSLIHEYNNQDKQIAQENAKPFEHNIFSDLTCTKCKETKPTGAFYYHYRKDQMRYSFSSWCRICTNRNPYIQTINRQVLVSSEYVLPLLTKHKKNEKFTTIAILDNEPYIDSLKLFLSIAVYGKKRIGKVESELGLFKGNFNNMLKNKLLIPDGFFRILDNYLSTTSFDKVTKRKGRPKRQVKYTLPIMTHTPSTMSQKINPIALSSLTNYYSHMLAEIKKSHYCK